MQKKRRNADLHRNVTVLVRKPNAATELIVRKEEALIEDKKEARAIDHRGAMVSPKVIAAVDRVVMNEAIRKEQADSMAAEKEIRVKDRRVADPDLTKQKVECSLAAVSGSHFCRRSSMTALPSASACA